MWTWAEKVARIGMLKCPLVSALTLQTVPSRQLLKGQLEKHSFGERRTNVQIKLFFESERDGSVSLIGVRVGGWGGGISRSQDFACAD